MKKILLIGMADSVHLANWLENMAALPVDVTLISSSPHRRLHPKIVGLIGTASQNGMRLAMPNWSRYFGFLFWLIDRPLGERLRGKLVRNLIQKLKPDLVHVVEFQHAGYILLKALAKPLFVERPKIMASNYGSDIYWFQKFSSHKAKISALLEASDHYTSECQRDIALAKRFGFVGTSTLIPNTGGVSDDLLLRQQVMSVASERKLLLLKGYHNKFGQALIGVRSILRIRKSLIGFEIVSFSTNIFTALFLILLRLFSGLNISFHLKGALTHSEVLTLMSRARIYLGLSKSDGISTSLLEAMARGAFPLQTGTSCASEWIEDGLSGAILTLGKEDELDNWITRAIFDDHLVNKAQEINHATILARYTKSAMTSQVENLYLKASIGEVSDKP
jgi:glycosyltransferase involved in cell wall biosynthesis